MHRSSTDLEPQSSPPAVLARTRRRLRGISAIVCCGLLASVPGASHAQEASSLEALIQEGIRLRREGEDEKALDVFRQAERLQPSSVRVLLHLATAAQAAGHWLEADTYIRRVFEYRDDPYYRRYQSDIAMVEQIIASRVGRFQVVGSPKGAEVRLNGRVVGHVPMEQPERLEAGNYQLEVVSEGHYALRRPQRIPASVLTREVVELGPVRSAAASASISDSGSPAGSWWSEPWVGWTLAGAGAASALTAGIAFAVREQQASDWNDDSRCVRPGGRTREQQCGSDYGDARLAERIGITASIGALVFGGAAALQFMARSGDEAPERPEAASAEWSPSCAPGWMSVVCEGRF
jgi:hypothetical protein